MKNKLLGTVLSILMVISVFSVGFSTWTIGYDEVYKDVSGNLEADSVIQMKDYVYVNTPTPLKYNKDGFIETNEENRYNSSIECNGVRIYFKKCLTDFNNVDKIQVVIDLEYIENVPSDMNIFKEEYLNIYINNIKADDSEITRNETSIRYVKTYDTAGIDLNTVTDEILIPIEYRFTLNNEFFDNEKSPLWTQSQPIFVMKTVLLFN